MKCQHLFEDSENAPQMPWKGSNKLVNIDHQVLEFGIAGVEGYIVQQVLIEHIINLISCLICVALFNGIIFTLMIVCGITWIFMLQGFQKSKKRSNPTQTSHQGIQNIQSK